MPVRLGTHPINWSNDDLPALGGHIPLETCLREARAAGFAGIELGGKMPRDPERLRAALDAHGLALTTGWHGGGLLDHDAAAEIEAMRPHADLLAAMGCRVLVFAETTGAVHGDRATPVGRRPVLERDDWKVLGGRLTEVADHLAGRGLRMAYHHHMGTVVETEEEVDRLMDAAGESVGLLLDTGHLTFAGGDPAGVAERHAARINHVHAKDVRRPVVEWARREDRSFLDAVIAGVYTTAGGGNVDFVPALKPLAAAGYDGWLVAEAEQDEAKAEPLLYARLGFAALSVFAREAGLEVASG